MRHFIDRIGVCSWSLLPKSVPELVGLTNRLGIQNVQIACGDLTHSSWDEGENMPALALMSGLNLTGAMIGFPGELYESPETIRLTSGFGNPDTRDVRMGVLRWALERTQKLQLSALTFHAGFIPADDGDYISFCNTLTEVADAAEEYRITLALETGQETADQLLRLLNDLNRENLGINFDPANMLLYDMDDPCQALQKLIPWVKSLHLKDAKRPTVKGQWGEEVILGKGQVNFPKLFEILAASNFDGPLAIEREVGTQDQRFHDIATGLEYLKQILN